MNIDHFEAARRVSCHPDTMRKMMASGEAPGTKIGRGWIVDEEIFQEWVNNRCRSTNEKIALTGGARLAATLASQRAQRIGKRLKNLSESSHNGNGGSKNSATVHPLHGPKSQSAG